MKRKHDIERGTDWNSKAEELRPTTYNNNNNNNCKHCCCWFAHVSDAHVVWLTEKREKPHFNNFTPEIIDLYPTIPDTK